MATTKFIEIPKFAYPTKGDVLSLFETFALLGLGQQWIRMSAEDQRRIIGFNVFGKQEFRMVDGDIVVRRSTCYGSDHESSAYSLARIKMAVEKNLKLSPGTFGPSYLC